MQMLVFLIMLSEIPTLQAYHQLPFKEAILFRSDDVELGYNVRIIPEPMPI